VVIVIALAAIIGKPRVIPIFESVTGNGNNAEYKIVRWQGIRIMAVKQTGSMSQKHVTIQEAPVVTPGVVPSSARPSTAIRVPQS
jgi:hypothetical protein